VNNTEELSATKERRCLAVLKYAGDSYRREGLPATLTRLLLDENLENPLVKLHMRTKTLRENKNA